MTYGYGDFNRAKHEPVNLETIAKALERGINFFDTAWMYQSYGDDNDKNTTNEELLGKAIKIHGREKFVIATKFGILPATENQPEGISGKGTFD
jgi:aryl-alcohol dehydrogenase-like predicted oxidoreductase